MPFELTHIVVGQQVYTKLNKPLTSSALAGMIYPDIRYPTNIDRRLTHELEPLNNCLDTDFVEGVKIHLNTDKTWDRLSLEAKIKKPDSKIPDEVFTGVLKLIQDRVVFDYMEDKQSILDKLDAFWLPNGLPVTKSQWQEWKEAIKKYVKDGPTQKGWLDIIVTINFQTIAEIEPRLKMIEQLSPKLAPVLENIYVQLVEDLRETYAGVA